MCLKFVQEKIFSYLIYLFIFSFPINIIINSQVWSGTFDNRLGRINVCKSSSAWIICELVVCISKILWLICGYLGILNLNMLYLFGIGVVLNQGNQGTSFSQVAHSLHLPHPAICNHFGLIDRWWRYPRIVNISNSSLYLVYFGYIYIYIYVRVCVCLWIYLDIEI